MGTLERTRRQYSPEDIERGLLAIVSTGNDHQAAELSGLPRETLRDWRTKHRDRLINLRDEHEGRIAKIIAGEAEELALIAGQKERALLEALNDETIAALKPAEIAATLRNVSTAKALQLDKVSSPLRERPSHVQHTNSPEELASRIARALGFTDSTAEEITSPTSSALPPASADLNALDQVPSSTS